MKTRKSITYLFRGLALGALMIAATGIYFGTTSSGAGDDPSLRGNQVGIAYPSSENSQGFQASASWVQRDEIERLESQIDRLLADAARDPSRNTPLLNREIERLDYQIDMLRLNAMQNQSADRPLSDSRAIERLEEQISIMLFNAARAGKPLSKKEIERLDAQMDLMLAAEAQDRSLYRPFSSEPSGTRTERLYPDTEYHLNPDWREYEVAK